MTTQPPPNDYGHTDFESQLFRWQMYSWQIACDICRMRNGQVKTLREWQAIGTPPIHPNCYCILVPA